MGYAIWDKVSPLYTPGHDENGKSKFTAEDMINQYAWAEISPAIISDQPLNGAYFMEYWQTMANYKSMGFEPTNINDPEATVIELTQWEIDRNIRDAEMAKEQMEMENAVKNSQIEANAALITQAELMAYQVAVGEEE